MFSHNYLIVKKKRNVGEVSQGNLGWDNVSKKLYTSYWVQILGPEIRRPISADSNQITQLECQSTQILLHERRQSFWSSNHIQIIGQILE